MDSNTLALGAIWYVIFLFSTTCHEASHALAAKLGGDLTAFHGGQVSLDPIPHIRREPFGMVLFPLLSYFAGGTMMGWASAPYDPLWARRHPKRAAWMALAGPAANFTLVLLAAALIRGGMATGAFAPPDQIRFAQIVSAATPGAAMEGAAALVSVLFSLNLLLGFFNLIPLPPLDGFGVAGLFLTEKGAQKLQDFGASIRAFSMIGLLIAWRLFDPMFDVIFLNALRTLYPGLGYGR